MVLEGERAIAAARQVIGATDPLEASPGSIRGDFAIEMGTNMVHGSDSEESSLREAALFFPTSEGWPAPAISLWSSPRARRRAGRSWNGSVCSFVVVVPEVQELEHGDPAQVALENALRKAQAVLDDRARGSVSARPHSRPTDKELILGVDTLVSKDGQIYGKPRDLDHARQTLRMLSGASHEVLSGIALLGPGGLARRVLTRTSVSFRALDERTLEWYLRTGEWQQRAGAYAIQGAGAALVREISGDYQNVVGLPLTSLLDMCPGLLTGGV